MEILTKYTAIKDPAVYKKIVVPAFSPNGEMNVQSIKDLQQWYVDNGFVQTRWRWTSSSTRATWTTG